MLERVRKDNTCTFSQRLRGVQGSAKIIFLGCVIPPPGSLWPWGPVYATLQSNFCRTLYASSLAGLARRRCDDGHAMSHKIERENEKREKCGERETA